MFRLRLAERKLVLVFTLLAALSGGLAYFWYYRHRDVRPAYAPLTRGEESLTQTLDRPAAPPRPASAKPFPFDPNRADSLTLIRVGLPAWQVHNVLKYRRKGGRWRSPDDFRRLYGLTEEDFRRLRPYLRIAPEPAAAASASPSADGPSGAPNGRTEGKAQPDHQVKRTEKFAEGTVLALNEADTTALKHIPGIGSYYAGKIVRYREALGGFTSLDQLDEIEGLPAGISRWFTLSPYRPPRRRNLNTASFKELVRHPYLSYEQVKDLFNHRRNYGPVRSWNDLRLFPHFSEADLARLQLYFKLDEAEGERD